MITCTRRFSFCAGHRVAEHESKCRNLHGHNYIAEVEVRGSDGLDLLGRVVDFAVLKQVLGTWIDENWDHGFLVWCKDAEAKAVLARMPGQKIHELPDNPTAENMAKELLRVARASEVLAASGVVPVSVRVVETENCWAEVLA